MADFVLRNYSITKIGEIEMATEQTSQNRLIPVTKWVNYYDYPTIGALRALIFNAHQNGFSKVIRRINGRVLLKESAYFEWVEEINGNGGK